MLTIPEMQAALKTATVEQVSGWIAELNAVLKRALIARDYPTAKTLEAAIAEFTTAMVAKANSKEKPSEPIRKEDEADGGPGVAGQEQDRSQGDSSEGGAQEVRQEEVPAEGRGRSKGQSVQKGLLKQ